MTLEEAKAFFNKKYPHCDPAMVEKANREHPELIIQILESDTLAPRLLTSFLEGLTRFSDPKYAKYFLQHLCHTAPMVQTAAVRGLGDLMRKDKDDGAIRESTANTLKFYILDLRVIIDRNRVLISEIEEELNRDNADRAFKKAREQREKEEAANPNKEEKKNDPVQGRKPRGTERNY